MFVVILVISSCAGTTGKENQEANSFPDQEKIDTMLIQDPATNKWDTNIVKHVMKYNVEKKKYDTTDVYLKEQMKMH